jgi:hypothetical protein
MKKMNLESAFGGCKFSMKIHQEVAEIHKFIQNKTNGRRTIKKIPV